MKHWPRRFAAMIWEDPTRQVQFMCIGAALLVSYWLIRFETPANASTARAVYYYLGAHYLATILILAAGIQLAALAGPSWKARLGAAVVKCFLWLYATACFWLTSPDALASALLPVFVGAEAWVIYRAIHDKDINGTDRRNDGLARTGHG